MQALRITSPCSHLHKAQFHQLAGGVVNDHQQRARVAALLKPAVVTCRSGSARHSSCTGTAWWKVLRWVRDSHTPSAIIHRLSVSLSTPKLMLAQQHLGRERRSDVRAPGLDQLDGIPPHISAVTPVRRPAARLMDHSAATLGLVPGQQRNGLALADREHGCCRSHRPTSVRTSLNTSIRFRSRSLKESHPIVQS